MAQTYSNFKHNVLIIGAGGHGSELASYLPDLSEQGETLQLVGFIDEGKQAGPWRESEILGDFAALGIYVNQRPGTLFQYITAVGHNRTRQAFVNKIDKLAAVNMVPWTLRHPTAFVGAAVEIGDGTCLAPGSLITTRVQLGRHCIVNIKASISHDCQIGDFVNLNPGVSVCGNVNIGIGCYVGAGATIIDKVSIGEWSVIGAGATVVDDIPDHVTVVGVPARIIKHHDR